MSKEDNKENELVSYHFKIKAECMKKFPNISENDIDVGLNKNISFIKFCFENEYSVNHVVHELSV